MKINSLQQKENHREISLQEVAKHDNIADCWIVICDHVYDVTDFISEHPGGDFIILEEAGKDATFSFLEAGHSLPSNMLKKYLIGILPSSERLNYLHSKLDQK